LKFPVPGSQSSGDSIIPFPQILGSVIEPVPEFVPDVEPVPLPEGVPV